MLHTSNSLPVEKNNTYSNKSVQTEGRNLKCEVDLDARIAEKACAFIFFL